MKWTFATLLTLLTAAACGGQPKPEAQAPASTPAATPPATTETTSASLPPPAKGGSDDELGDLETKRMVQNITNDIPKHKERFKKLCGFDVQVEIDWNSFGHDKKGLETLWSNYGVERLVAAFEGPCRDQLGKDAVKAKVKKIRAVNVREASKVKATITGGAFVAELAWSTGTTGMNENELGAAITKQL